MVIRARVLGPHFNLVTRGQEGVETTDQVRPSFEQITHSSNHTRGVDAEIVRT